MRVAQKLWTASQGWTLLDQYPDVENPNLIVYFGSLSVLQKGTALQELKERYPEAVLMGCSSGGEIVNRQLLDDTIIANLILFEKTPFQHTFTLVEHSEDSFKKGQDIGQTLLKSDLKSIFVLSDGVIVNGVELVRGIASIVGDHIPITGGFAADRVDLFTISLVGLNNTPVSGGVAALGLYGSAIRVGHGSVGGWDPFGPERIVTRSKGRVVYELDHKPVLKLYKSYLEEKADGLPGTGLLFPLAIRASKEQRDWTVRTMIAINEEEQSITFAGDIPEGYICQLMHGNFDRLVDGAVDAARQASPPPYNFWKLGILVSCIGRRVLMGQRVVDEVEAVYEFWKGVLPVAGFYSYGEISPLVQSGVCAFHNQTMTITTWGEDLT